MIKDKPRKAIQAGDYGKPAAETQSKPLTQQSTPRPARETDGRKTLSLWAGA